MTRQIDSNEALALDLLNYSPFGAMGQVFVMEAIRHYAESVVAGKDVNAPLKGPVWVQIAQDVKTRCDAFYDRHNRAREEQTSDSAAG